MSRDEHPATAQEEVAVDTIRNALVGPASLAARLRSGEALDGNLLSRLLGALDFLAGAWSDRQAIPKDLAAAFVDVQGPLLQASTTQDVAQQNAVEDAANEIVDAIYALLEEQADIPQAGTASSAAQTLHEGLTTGQSLQYKLRTGQGLDDRQLEELRAAFLTLIRGHSCASHVPKLVAAACVDLPSSMLQGLGRYPPEQVAQISAASADLTALARTLLKTEGE